MSEKKNTNPYTDAKEEWNERYGSHIAQARNWRLVAILSMFVTMGAVGGMIYSSALPKAKPYLVNIDKHGQAKGIGYLPSLKINENVVKFTLADFISNYRTVYLDDPKIQKKMIFTAYKYLSPSLPAYNQIAFEYQNNSPFLADSSRRIEIKSILPLGRDRLYQIDWVENITSKKGENRGIEEYRATVTIMFEAPSKEEEILENPIGLFINTLAIQKLIN